MNDRNVGSGYGGIAIALAGIVILMGIITAESQYPHPYTTHQNEISDLGATRPPDSVSYQPSARIFNLTMLAGGAALVAGGASVFATFSQRSPGIAIVMMGLGVFGVGVFPGNHGAIHPWFALLAFGAGGVSGILAARIIEGPFRVVSVALGATSLVALGFGMFGAETALFEWFGDGGIERWVAYPIILWATTFGGYLMALHGGSRSGRSDPAASAG